MAQVRPALRAQRSVTKRDSAATFRTHRPDIETLSRGSAAARFVSTAMKESR
jgi:hypothetical protein